MTTPASAFLPFSGHLSVSVRSRDTDLVRRVEGVFSAGALPLATATEKPPVVLFEVEMNSADDGGGYTVWVGGADVFRSASRDTILWFIEGQVTERLTKRLRAYHLFHGGAVRFKGRGALLPGESGAGKSTTVAAMALSGAEYLSDEVVVVDPELRAHPFPRVIGLKQGGWEAVKSAFPDLVRSGAVSDGAGAGAPVHMRYLRPPVVAAGGGDAPVKIDCIILPHREPGGKAQLTRVPRSQALTTLMTQSLDLPLWRRPGFEVIMKLVQQADCYSLTVPDLPEVIAALHSLPASGEAAASGKSLSLT